MLISDSFLKSVNCMYEVLEIMKEKFNGIKLYQWASFGTRVKKSEDIARFIAEFLVNIADMKNSDINNIHEAIYQRIQMYV